MAHFFFSVFAFASHSFFCQRHDFFCRSYLENVPVCANNSLVTHAFILSQSTPNYLVLLMLFAMVSTLQKEFQLLQVRYEEIMSDSASLDKVLAEGATKAADIADATLNNVYQAMGFLRR